MTDLQWFKFVLKIYNTLQVIMICYKICEKYCYCLNFFNQLYIG